MSDFMLCGSWLCLAEWCCLWFISSFGSGLVVIILMVFGEVYTLYTVRNISMNWMLPWHIQGNEQRSVINLFSCLQAIESLTIQLWVIQYFAQDIAPRRLPTPLVNLRYLYLKKALFVDKYDNFPFFLF